MAQPERRFPHDEESVADTFRELLSDVGDLIRSEIQLATLEMKTAGVALSRGVVLIGAGLAIIYLALVFLLLAATAALASTMPFSTAALIVGVVVLVVGALAAWLGYGRLRSARRDLALPATRETLREDAEWYRSRTR